MRIVGQKNSLDCGIAAAAMACGVGYSRAAACDPNPSSGSGITVRQMPVLLQRVGGKQWEAQPRGNPPVAQMELPRRIEVWIIARLRDRSGHWVVASPGGIYDPDLGHVGPRMIEWKYEGKEVSSAVVQVPQPRRGRTRADRQPER